MDLFRESTLGRAEGEGVTELVKGRYSQLYTLQHQELRLKLLEDTLYSFKQILRHDDGSGETVFSSIRRKPFSSSQLT